MAAHINELFPPANPIAEYASVKPREGRGTSNGGIYPQEPARELPARPQRVYVDPSTRLEAVPADLAEALELAATAPEQYEALKSAPPSNEKQQLESEVARLAALLRTAQEALDEFNS